METAKNKKTKDSSNIKHITWAITLCVMTFFLTFSASQMVTFLEKSGRKMRKITEILKPNVTIKTNLLNTIEKLQKSGKLVVLTPQITADITKKSSKKWLGLNMGTTKVNCKLRENKVQFIIPTQDLSNSSFHIDDEQKVVTVTVPKPVVDRTFVQVQSNPDLIEIDTQVGWGRLKSRSGIALKRQIMRESRTQILETANNSPYLAFEAEANAKKIVAELFENAINRSEQYYTCKVEFE